MSLTECFISKIDIEKFEDLNFNKNEVENYFLYL